MDRSAATRVYSSNEWWSAAPSSPSVMLNASQSFLDFLESERVSVMVASRQSNVLAVIFASNGKARMQGVRLPGPMGLTLNGQTLAIGTGSAIRVFRNVAESSDAAKFYPVTMHSIGDVSIHDVGWCHDGRLAFVNTAFSSVCNVGNDCNFIEYWSPQFVSERGPFDCCHLNGMALLGGEPRFLTALAATGAKEGWRGQPKDAGVLIDTTFGILRAGLSVPHSPTVVGNSLFVLESGAGRLLEFDLAGDLIRAVRIEFGVLRGLGVSKHHLVLGASRIRQGSEASGYFATRIADLNCCRLVLVDRANGAETGFAEVPGVGEISSVMVAPFQRCDFLDPKSGFGSSTYVYRAQSPLYV